MAITITESAADRVRSYIESRGTGVGLRLGIKKTGCSGFAYVVGYADVVNDDDVIFEDRDIKIVVDKECLTYIDGTEVDFVKEGLSEAFRFLNPNVQGECGCGESFSI